VAAVILGFVSLYSGRHRPPLRARMVWCCDRDGV
jgi:hypothetical protein